MDKKVYIGSDKNSHGLKKELKEFLKSKGTEFIDLGIFEGDETDFEHIKREVDEKVREEENALGFLIYGKQ